MDNNNHQHLGLLNSIEKVTNYLVHSSLKLVLKFIVVKLIYIFVFWNMGKATNQTKPKKWMPLFEMENFYVGNFSNYFSISLSFGLCKH
ncbi:hypothetical protein BLOT_014687 [Blomia tropicalis]|nr:hypothetical protein BLOT_014687 [Blomia tropicalis]